MNRVFRRWLHRLAPHAAGPSLPRPAAPPTADTAPAAEDDTPPRGCAWYDSSLDLRRGLLVRECAIQIVNA